LNSLEKKSFYSFLSLYIISSILFILLSAYWYYKAQKNAIENNEYYQLQHISDTLSGNIIKAHMQKLLLKIPSFEKDIHLYIISTDNDILYGKALHGYSPTKPGYTNFAGNNVLVSDTAKKHLNVKFVVIYSNLLTSKISALKQTILEIIILAILIIISLAWILSLLFMKPLRKKIQQIEDFVHDTAHELNTPITALSMSVSRAKKKDMYDANILKNISVSTKQLFDIYTALSYLSFESKQKNETKIDIAKTLQKSVSYYQELSQSKKIELILETQSYEFEIDETKLTMLFGNLINNAIKYSHPNSKIEISLKNAVFKIKDYGIGIEKNKLANIYEKYNRETDYAGGFGVGLSIVQKISYEYGLKLDAHSKINKGSTFCINFS